MFFYALRIVRSTLQPLEPFKHTQESILCDEVYA